MSVYFQHSIPQGIYVSFIIRDGHWYWLNLDLMEFETVDSPANKPSFVPCKIIAHPLLKVKFISDYQKMYPGPMKLIARDSKGVMSTISVELEGDYVG